MQLSSSNLKIYSLWDWKENESPRVSAIIKKIKNQKKEKIIIPYVKSFLLNRNRFSENYAGSVLVPSPAKNLGKLDHALLLTQGFSQITGLPIWNKLRRADEGHSQKTKKLSERRNIQIESSENFTHSGKVILVDDVVTTGSTALACWQALGKPKAFEVWCLAHRSPIATPNIN